MRFEELLTEARGVDPYKVVVDLYNKSFPFIKEYLKYFRAEPRDNFFWSGRGGSRIYDIKKIRKDRYPKDTPEHIHEWFDDQFQNHYGVRYRSNSIFVTGHTGNASSYGDHVYAIFPIGTKYSFIHHPHISDLYSETVDSGDYPYLGMEIQDIATEILSGDGWGFDSEIWDEARERATEDFHDSHSPEDYEEEDEDGDIVTDEDSFEQDLENYIEDHQDTIAERLAMEKAEEIEEDGNSQIEDYIRNYRENDLKGAIMSNNEIMLSGDSYQMVRRDYMSYVMRYMEVMKSQKPTPERWAEAMRNFKPEKYKKLGNPKMMASNMRKYVNKDLLAMMDELKAP